MNHELEPTLSRSQKKRAAIIQAAKRLFLEKGFDATTMDDVCALAPVSKPTLYRYVADKDALYAAVVQATVDDVSELVRLVTAELDGDRHPRNGLRRLALKLLKVLTAPDLIRLRRLVITQAERFPDVGRDWYALGFGRVLNSFATAFQQFADKGYLRVRDPMLAANHFTGLLLWIPLNQAMFTGETGCSDSELEKHARGAVEAFLNGYEARPSSG